MTATETPEGACPKNPLHHDWAAGLRCRACGETRTASEAIESGLSSVRGWSDQDARAVRAAYRAEVFAEVAELLRTDGWRYCAGLVEAQLEIEALDVKQDADPRNRLHG